MNRETLAAIDIGSNAIRLLITYIEQNRTNTQFKKAAFVRVPIRLGEDVFTIGKIGETKRVRLTKAMVAFSHMMQTFNVKRYRACATSAMREASNGADIIEYIRENSGIGIDIISGIEEAETIFNASAITNLMSGEPRYLFVDVGGGSTEVTIYSNHRRVDSMSFRLGTVRMISGAVDKNEMNRFKTWLETAAATHNPLAIIGSGGNINKLYKLLQKKDREAMQYAELKALYDKMKQMSFEERMVKLKLNIYRADVIMPAAKIFLTACKYCGINDILVPKIGLADGVIHELYRQECQERKSTTDGATLLHL